MIDFYSYVIQKLVDGGISNPRLEARILISHVLECSPSEIYMGKEIDDINKEKIEKLLTKRINHYPLDKIIGHKEFFKAEFFTNEYVLSPRCDTEILVESVLEYTREKTDVSILDLGTGSGCIIESLLLEMPSAKGDAVDISDEALKVAKQNARKLGVNERINFIQADWFANNFLKNFNQQYDIIVTNPPYIPSDDIKKLDDEVKEHDPILALDGGKDGLDSYIRISELAPDLLKDNGLIFIEAGIFQSQEIIKIFSKKGFILKTTACDLSSIERCVIMQKAIAEIKKN